MYFIYNGNPKNCVETGAFKFIKKILIGENQNPFKNSYDESKHFIISKIVNEDYHVSIDGIYFHKTKKPWYYYNSCYKPLGVLFVSKDGKTFVEDKTIHLDLSHHRLGEIRLMNYENMMFLLKYLLNIFINNTIFVFCQRQI